MSRPSSLSATSPTALDIGSAPTPARLAAGAIGDSASKAALAKLTAAVDELKVLKVQPMLHQAVAALNAGDAKAGAEWAIKALEQDERNGFGWYLLAIAREKASDFVGSITCYESALALLPDHAEIANNLGRLAYRLPAIQPGDAARRIRRGEDDDHLDVPVAHRIQVGSEFAHAVRQSRYSPIKRVKQTPGNH